MTREAEALSALVGVLPGSRLDSCLRGQLWRIRSDEHREGGRTATADWAQAVAEGYESPAFLSVGRFPGVAPEILERCLDERRESRT